MKNIFSKEMKEKTTLNIARFTKDITMWMTKEKIFEFYEKVIAKSNYKNRLSYLLKTNAEGAKLAKSDKAKFVDEKFAISYIQARDAVIITRAVREKVPCKLNENGNIEIDGIEVKDGDDFFKKLVETAKEYHTTSVSAAIHNKGTFGEDEEELPSIDDEYFEQ